MGNSYDPRLSMFEVLLDVGAMFYEEEFGTHEEDKSKTIDEETERDARIFGNKVPRKKRSHRILISSSSRTMITPSTGVTTQQRSSEPQNPNAKLETSSSSSSCVIQSSKKRRLKEEEEKKERRFFKKRKIVRRVDVGPTRATPPEWLVNGTMREANGYNLKLIMKKQLYKSDLAKLQSRLSLPFNQIINSDFLTEEETRTIHEQMMKIHKKGLCVDLVDPQREKRVVNLRKWKMGGSWNYVFVDGWNDVVAANRFKVDDVFHVWCFRSGNGNLCFTLVPFTASHGGGSASGESGHGNTLPEDNSGHCASTSGECSHGGSNLDDSLPV